ncbi:hypothetical protein [Mucilaginibacter sp. PPCGB 2223]|nr:hypothetical protein [Mucilaginibacter sp. PPCGB 2223]
MLRTKSRLRITAIVILIFTAVPALYSGCQLTNFRTGIRWG